MRQKQTLLWNPSKVQESNKDEWITTNQRFFCDKSIALKSRKIVKGEYKDDIWYLGYSDSEILDRRNE
jgi:hypothetical protein